MATLIASSIFTQIKDSKKKKKYGMICRKSLSNAGMRDL